MQGLDVRVHVLACGVWISRPGVFGDSVTSPARLHGGPGTQKMEPPNCNAYPSTSQQSGLLGGPFWGFLRP